MSSPVIGRYSLERLLGRGSLGEVWEARTEGNPVPLALTVLRTPPDPRVRTSLLRDLRAAARVRSPHFAAVLDVTEVEGQFAVANELVQGKPLLSYGALAGSRLLDASLALVRGLRHLHTVPAADYAERGFVHRALRPSGVLLDDRGRVVMTDLGLFRVSGAAIQGWTVEDLDAAPDPRNDLFSLGAVLYTLATESSPFGTGPGAPADIRRVEDRLVDPSFLGPVDQALPGLGAIVHRCLRRRPEDRFSSAAALEDALAALSGGGDHRALLDLVRVQSHNTPPITVSSRPIDPRQGRPAPPRPRAPVRAEALDATLQRLRSGSRFVFVDGPSGAGRTSFALELARRLSKEHPAGARHIDVSRCESTEDLQCAVAASLGLLPDVGSKGSRLGRILARRGKLLLVLDGVDGVLGAVPSVVADWLAAAPEVTVLCTGSHPPRGAEHVTLTPLTPEDGRVLWTAVRGWAADDDGAEFARAMATVGGQPLAVDVLARATGPAPLAVLVRRLRDRASLMDADEPDGPTRVALDVAAELLPEWGRAGVHQLAVFEGPFTLVEAGAVVDLSAWADAPFPPGVVGLLEEHGFLRRERAADSGPEAHAVPGRPPRWRLHDAVRTWAVARSSPLDLELSRIRHRYCACELGAPDVLRALRGGHPGWRPGDLAPAQWDLVAAVRMSLAERDGPLAAKAFRALAAIGGEGLSTARKLELGRAVSELDLPDADRTHVESAVADAAGALGRTAERVSRREAAFGAAAACGDQATEVELRLAGDLPEVDLALRVARRLADPMLLARTATRRAELLVEAGRAGEAREMLLEALAAAQRGPAPETTARAGHLLGRQLVHLRDPEAAIERLTAAIAAWDTLGERHRAGPVEVDLGGLLLDIGRPDAAMRHLVSAATSLRALGDASAEAEAVARLGEVSHWCGRFDGALRHLDDALRTQRRLQDVEGLCRTLALLGLVHTETGRLRDARDAFDEGLALGASRCRAELELGRVGADFAEGRLDGVRDPVLRCLADGRATGNPLLVGRSLALLGRLSFREGDPDTARSRLEAAVEELSGRALGWRILAELDLANVLDAQGEGRVALTALEGAASALRVAGFLPTLALVLCTRAKLHLRSGRPADAEPDVAEARTIAKGFQLGARAPLARALEGLKNLQAR